MNENKKFALKNLLSAVLLAVLCFALVLTAACNNGSGSASTSASDSTSASSSSAVTAKTDYQVVTNGDFEFGTDDKEATAYPVSSSVNWTRSNDSLLNSATSSSKLSGIIDTTPDVYEQIAESQDFPVVDPDASEKTYFNPFTPEHFGLVDAEDLYTYDENNANESKKPTSGSKILMIHNVTSEEGRGTAQKFTSTKTFDVKSYGKISVWVATKDLKTVQDTDEFGAYVQLRTTIDSEIAPLTVKNINTDGEWIQVNFYVAAHDFAATKFRMVLGLGFGSKDVRQEYVEGFAYFDNVTYEELTYEQFEEYANIVEDELFDYYDVDLSIGNGSGWDSLTKKDELAWSMATEGHKKPVLSNEEGNFTSYNFTVFCHFETTAFGYVNATGVNDNYAHADADYGSDIVAGAGDAFPDDPLLDGVEDSFAARPSVSDVAYILHPTNASSYLKLFPVFHLNDGEAVYISFYAKVETKMNMPGLTVSLTDHGSVGGDAKTTLISAFTTNDYEDEEYNDFVKVNLLIENNVGDGEQRNFDLVFDFGTTSAVTDYKKLTSGYALMTQFRYAVITNEEFKRASGGSYTGIASLGADKPNGTAAEDPDDTYAFNYSAAENTTVMKTPASSVTGYTGVVANHKMVGGENTAYKQDGTTSGIVNTKYADDYTELTPEEKAALNALEKSGDNKYLQALMIKNANSAAYGFVGTSREITAGSSALVSVKVKVLGDAKAYVYLVNADSLSGFGVLDLTTYKYNNDTHTLTEEVAFSKKFVFDVSAADSADGWVTVNFLLTAGNGNIEYRVELWNGARDGTANSAGTVFFDDLTVSSVSDDTTLKAKLAADYPDDMPASENYTRVPTKVNYKDEDGNDAVKYETYSPTEVFTE
ncbi:MAG: hypothetical protein ILP02_02975, partial [Clostridia bacterium]|nr:hypothetical protein [Clostridia bacterium]